MIWGGVKVVTRGHSLLKQACNEIPEAVAAVLLFVAGSGMLFYGCYNMDKNNMKYKRFQDRYTVYRPENPKAQYVSEIKLR